MSKACFALIVVTALAPAAFGQNESALADRRAKIDALDARIVALLNERAEIVRDVGRIKKQSGTAAADPKRAEQVLQRIVSANHGPLPNENLRRIYETIVNEMAAFEAADMSRK